MVFLCMVEEVPHDAICNYRSYVVVCMSNSSWCSYRSLENLCGDEVRSCAESMRWEKRSSGLYAMLVLWEAQPWRGWSHRA